jgi:phosphoribosylformimino-5-aminoimidazole carboxamide ribotide isomerase
VQVIDLDAAKEAGSNRDLVRYICERLPCQVGGGIRSVEAAREILDSGARRVIVGSALFTKDGVDVDAARQFSDAIGRESLVAAIDGRGGRVAVRGWTTTLDLLVRDAMPPLQPFVGAFLATLIDGEGKLGGIDMVTAENLRQATPRPLIVAGGIRSMEEVEQLAALGIDAVVGMAIYTGLIGEYVARPGSQARDRAEDAAGRGTSRAEAVIFDFDGVIADSEAQHFRAFQQTLAERGWHLSEADYYGRFLGYSDREVFEMVAREQGQPLAEGELERLIESKGRAYEALISARDDGRARLCPGAADVIHRLAEHFPLAIASSAFATEIVDFLETSELLSFFKVIVGAEDVAESKPSPAPYLEAARRLGIPPEACVAIEDSPWGLESAHRAGLRTIGITHTYPPGRLIPADVVVRSHDEITEPFVRSLFVGT